MDTIQMTEKIENIAYRMLEKNTLYEIQEKVLDIWDETDHEPMYNIEPDRALTCAVMGSGSFSTGREELWRGKKLRDRLGWPPVDYKAVITNRKNSNARKVVEEYNNSVSKEYEVSYILLDYGDWKRENGITGSTKIFGFKPDEIPPPEVLQERFEIRKRYDNDLKKIIIEELGEMPSSLSLRGYNSILTDTFFPKDRKIRADNTHPATLIIREKDGKPRYAGWQEDATNKMVEDGWKTFPASLIMVGPIVKCERLGSDVDSGELVGISPGNPGEYRKTEDYFVQVLKLSGLIPSMWGLSGEKKLVEYSTLGKEPEDREPVMVGQREVIVGDRIMSGVNAFGQKPEDLDIFSKFMS